MPGELTKEEEQKIWEQAAQSAQEAANSGNMSKKDADGWEAAASRGRRSDNDKKKK
ncbi:hypothetical protein BJX68DRAFT_261843 [Aspergillus pseudodeflectus]|uniref:Uncharacterized protein n=1 Tax=Aspergillus pseudodeflectus TaxID=176178 RepID=A0ABR4L4C8_9EURO